MGLSNGDDDEKTDDEDTERDVVGGRSDRNRWRKNVSADNISMTM